MKFQSRKDTPQVNRPRHTRVNRRQWIEAKRRYEAAMEDGRIDPHEHASIVSALEGGEAVGAVLDAGDALAQAAERATDPTYIVSLTQVYLSHAERLPAA